MVRRRCEELNPVLLQVPRREEEERNRRREEEVAGRSIPRRNSPSTASDVGR